MTDKHVAAVRWMPSKKQGPDGLGAGCVFWLLATMVWLVISNPWVLLIPIAIWLCIFLSTRPKKVRGRPPRQPVTPAPVARTMAPRTRVAMPPARTNPPAPLPKVIPKPVKIAPPDFIPKDREYNRYLARTWDEEFEALVKKQEQLPPK
jgi:hypothetical protein